MPLLRRKEQNLIPPVQDTYSTDSRTPSKTTRSSASTYNASRDGDLSVGANRPYYGRTESGGSGDNESILSSRYGKNVGVGDVYSRGERNLDADRNELFSGYDPKTRSGSNRFRDGASTRSYDDTPGENEEEDVEAIKRDTRFTKQESVNSTRNALRIAREAEETGRNTLLKLGDQSEKIANTERHLDVSKGHSLRAEDKTDELKQLNRSIFRPVITFNKEAKRAAQEAKRQARHDEEREEREKAMSDIRDSQNRIGRAATYRSRDEDEDIFFSGGGGTGGSGGRFRTSADQAARAEQRKRYQFEATASDDEMEDELDDNLDEISDMTKRLKTLGMAMGQELDQQIGRLNRLDDKTVNLDNRVLRNTDRLKRIK
ncbi:synaptosome-associated proteinsynaptosomal-associated protein 25 [Sistotremastrum niveocremeum HHB9708]|uniref:Synaptosome-associated proteinsynaptosomal-associated protein 25 n=1 Tax=Sistotremastrum niveocremeum HHB9708 TaxID=1314777 RepID=A0A164U7M6_9AGAM|nr:synaptosome-associated proteinsynaptosomal-associated protein 25 [Sistotremastrum niveocremeum HHB9708]